MLGLVSYIARHQHTEAMRRDSSPLTRGVFVRVTTDRLVSEGVARGVGAFTLSRHRNDRARWIVRCDGGYFDLHESELEFVAAGLPPRGCVLPSLNGGWFAVEPFGDRARSSKEISGVPVLQLWGRLPSPEDFLGDISLVLPDGDATGFPVLWDRERQLKLVHFLDEPHRMTRVFPRRTRLGWPGDELQIDAEVTIDSDRGRHARTSAELDITTRNPMGDRREVSAHLIVPAQACKTASRALVDLFPSVSADDLDFV